MAAFKRYWIALLVLVLVIAHAGILGYVRSQIARLKNVKSTAVDVGSFRFQPMHDGNAVCSFDLHAVLAPRLRIQGEELLAQYQTELHELIEQTLRQVDPVWLADPEQKELRHRLKDLISERLNEPIIERVVITNWLMQPPISNEYVSAATKLTQSHDVQDSHAADGEGHEEADHHDAGESEHDAGGSHESSSH